MKDTCLDVDVISNERIDLVDPVVIVCEDEVHSISQNSPVRKTVYGNQGKGIDSSVPLYNVIVEVNPQVFEVAVNLEESDVIFEDAEVDVCDLLDHDSKLAESVVNDSIVVS